MRRHSSNIPSHDSRETFAPRELHLAFRRRCPAGNAHRDWRLARVSSPYWCPRAMWPSDRGRPGDLARCTRRQRTNGRQRAVTCRSIGPIGTDAAFHVEHSTTALPSAATSAPAAVDAHPTGASHPEADVSRETSARRRRPSPSPGDEPPGLPAGELTLELGQHPKRESAVATHHAAPRVDGRRGYRVPGWCFTSNITAAAASHVIAWRADGPVRTDRAMFHVKPGNEYSRPRWPAATNVLVLTSEGGSQLRLKSSKTRLRCSGPFPAG